MKTLRVTGGRWRGQLLATSRQQTLRPTASRVRKALFDICQTMIEGAEVLDLFAGAGAVGIEALSRGAKRATFIEREAESIRALRRNVEMLRAEPASYRIVQGDVLLHIARLKGTFDLIYVDPPYHYEGHAALMRSIEEGGLLAPQGLLFIEESSSARLPPSPRLHCRRTYSYGTTALHQYLLSD